MDATQDPSRRHVLPADAPLVKNLAALWAVDPKLAAAIDALDRQPRYAVEPSKAGEPTVAMRTPDGRTIYLHSRHQPIDEAKRLIAGAEVGEKTLFCVHGFGLGYHVQQLFEAAGSEAIIVVLEPDVLLLRTAFEHRDCSALIESRRVLFFTQLDKADLYQRLGPHTAMLSVGLAYISHAASLQIQGEFHKQMQDWLGEFAAYCRTNLNTLLLNGRRTTENIASNLDWYIAAPGLSRLQNRYKKRPAIIVSAGPSLRKNKHLLRDASGRAVIIAVQTTLKPLLELGVEPDFVTALDYHEISTRFFEKLPPILKTELIAEPKATSAIFNMHTGPITILGNDQADRLIPELKLERMRLRAGATVAHLAYYFAEHLGCDPIIFVGQDLGFSDGLCYTPGTSYEDVWRPELSRFCTVEMKQWEHIVRERHLLRKIPDTQGRPMYTEERLFAYLQQFERDFADSSARIIDATEGGALKRGTTIMTLAEALDQFCQPPLPAIARDHPGYRWDLLGQAVDCLRKRRAEAGQVGDITGQTLPLLEEIRDHLDDQPRVNRAIARIDALRARMNDLGPMYDLVTQMTQVSELQRFKRDRQISAAKLDGREKQRRQVERDVDNVRAVMEAAGIFQLLMDGIIERVSHSYAARCGGKAA